MPNLSFEIDTSKKFYLKLLEDHQDFLKDTTSSRHAINCAMTAFHLSEWIYHEYKKGPAKKKLIIAFQESLEAGCPELKVMHAITNGSKHFHPKGNLKTGFHGGAFDNSFDRSFDTSHLYTVDNNQKSYFEDQLKTVIDFWKNYFINELNETL